MVRYSFPVGLLHPRQHAGLSRRSDSRPLWDAYDTKPETPPLCHATFGVVRGVKLADCELTPASILRLDTLLDGRQ